MTEDRYEKPIESFSIDLKPKKWTVLDVIKNGPSELKRISDEMGLSFDEWDVQHYHDLFVNKLKRNPTSVECFDLAQSNSEHSRHWFFRVGSALPSLTRESTHGQTCERTSCPWPLFAYPNRANRA